MGQQRQEACRGATLTPGWSGAYAMQVYGGGSGVITRRWVHRVLVTSRGWVGPVGQSADRDGSWNGGPGCSAPGWWWLRSPGDNDNNTAVVAPGGWLDRNGNNVNNAAVGVRPDSSHFRAYGGLPAVRPGSWRGRSAHVGASVHGTKEPGSRPRRTVPTGVSAASRTQAAGDEDGSGTGQTGPRGSSPSVVGGRPAAYPPRQ